MKSEGERAGRPEAEIDLAQLEKLAGIACTVQEAASVLGVSKRTLARRLQEPEYQRVWQDGHNKGNVSLRRMQWTKAQSNSPASVAMLIHLSKHRLGQSEKSVVELRGADGGPIAFDFSRLDSLSIEEITFLAGIIEKLSSGSN